MKNFINGFRKWEKPMNIERKLQEFRELISLKDEIGIQNFYMNLHNETLELQDRNDYFYKFLMQFLNMKENSICNNKRKEPSTNKNYACIRTLFYKGENKEFYVDNFYTKEYLKFHPYWFNAMLYYNNLVGAETYLHKYEFKEKSLDSKTKCNHLIVIVSKQEDEAFFKESWIDTYKKQFEELNIFPRTVLSDGNKYIFIFELIRSVNLQIDSVRYFYETVEKRITKLFCKEFYIEEQSVILLPGSISKNAKIITQVKQPNIFLDKEFVNGEIIELETGFKKCYYQGLPFYDKEAINLSHLGNIFKICKKNKQKELFLQNKKKYTNVNLQRIEDLNIFLDLRNFNLLDERKDYFSILSNVYFYLENSLLETWNIVKEINQKLLYPLKEKNLYSIVCFQYEKYLEYKDNVSKGIKYTNEEIVNKLRITFEEQDSMFQLITKETAKLRKNFRDRKYSKKYYIKKEKKEKDNFSEELEKQDKIQNMLNLGYSKKEISKLLHISRNKIKME